MSDTIEDIIRRIVREELARQPQAPQTPTPTQYVMRCMFCGGFHGNGIMCPALRPTVISNSIGMDSARLYPDKIDQLRSSKGIPL